MSNKRRAPDTQSPGEGGIRKAFHMGDAEGEFGVGNVPFRHPRLRKYKEETAATESIGAQQYEEILATTAEAPKAWLTMVFPFKVAKKMPTPRAAKIAARTQKGLEKDMERGALDQQAALDAAAMPPPPPPRRRYTAQELRRVDLSEVMEELHEKDVGDILAHRLPKSGGVSSSVVTTDAMTVTHNGEQGTTTVTRQKTVSSTVTHQEAPAAPEEALPFTDVEEEFRQLAAAMPTSAPPTPLRSEIDGSVLPNLFGDASASPRYVRQSPYLGYSPLPASHARQSQPQTPLTMASPLWFGQPSASQRGASVPPSPLGLSQLAEESACASPLALPSPSAFQSPNGMPAFSPSLFRTPQSLTPSGPASFSSSASTSGDLDQVSMDLLKAHAACASLASRRGQSGQH